MFVIKIGKKWIQENEMNWAYDILLDRNMYVF